ncbi:hypothetical protein BH09SUM1_BH09SUM1_06280 [soil metagenome]
MNLTAVKAWIVARKFAILASLLFSLIFSSVFEGLRFYPPTDHGPGVYTGFTSYDSATYYANAAEIFDRGNGLLYGNPYDLSPHPPQIYFHLFTIVQAHVWHWLGAGPSIQEPLWRFVLGFIFLLLLDEAVGAFLKLPAGNRFRIYAHLVLICGGGLVSWWTLPSAFHTWFYMAPEFEGHVSFMDVWQHHMHRLEDDAIFGRWLLSPARVFLMTQELYYHALLYAGLLTFWKRRWWWCVAIMAIMWMSHPFTAVIGAALIGGGIALELCCDREFRRSFPIGVGAAMAAVQILGLSYYQLFLPSYEVHREVVANFSLPVSLQISTAPWSYVLFASGIFLPGAVIFLLSNRGRASLFSDPSVRFLIFWFMAIVLLTEHDKFVSHPVQPLHFARGYLLPPVALLALRGLLEIRKRWPGRPPRDYRLVIYVLALLTVPDTFFFFVAYPSRAEYVWNAGAWLPHGDAEVIEYLKTQPPAIILTIEEKPTSGLGYEIPTWTRHRTILAHGCNTPWLAERLKFCVDFLAAPSGKMLGEKNIDIVVVDAPALPEIDATGALTKSLAAFEKRHENEHWQVWVRREKNSRDGL